MEISVEYKPITINEYRVSLMDILLTMEVVKIVDNMKPISKTIKENLTIMLIGNDNEQYIIRVETDGLNVIKFIRIGHHKGIIRDESLTLSFSCEDLTKNIIDFICHSGEVSFNKFIFDHNDSKIIFYGKIPIDETPKQRKTLNITWIK